MELAGGRYKLEDVIGQGGFATVWRGYDTALGVHRAVKLLHPNLNHRVQFRERLRAEARAMARLAHPNVLTVHDIGEQDGQDWFVMDLVEGGSLGDWQKRGGALPPDLAVACMVQVLSALGAAHASGIVHRDVKPQNILLDGDGRCLLADFGIALLESEEMLHNTKTGATMGSLSYMAPEQRLSAKGVGPTADLYAVGSTLYALLTDANAIDLFTALPDSPRWHEIPPELQPILWKLTQHEPKLRHQSASEVAAELEAAKLSLTESDWSAWMSRVSMARPGAGPTLVMPTVDLLKRSTQHAFTILEPGDPASPSPTAVPATHTAQETYFEPPLDDSQADAVLPIVGDNDTQLPFDSPPRRSPWLAIGGVASIGLMTLLGLLWWAPWSVEAPLTTAQSSLEPAVQEFEPPPPENPTAEDPAPSPENQTQGPENQTESPENPAPSSETPAPNPSTSQPTVQPDTTPVEPQPTAAASSVAGAWTGSLGAGVTTLRLRGSDASLRGTLETNFMGNIQASQVTGRFEGGQIYLEDNDRSASYAASYAGELTEAGRIEGQCTTFAGSRITTFSFTRSR